MENKLSQILQNNPGASIFLTGPVNSGKTSAMKAILSKIDFQPNLSTYEPFELNHAPLHQLTGKTLFLDGLCTQETALSLLLLRLNKRLRTFCTCDVPLSEIPEPYLSKIQSKMIVLDFWQETSLSSNPGTPENTNIFSNILKRITK